MRTMQIYQVPIKWQNEQMIRVRANSPTEAAKLLRDNLGSLDLSEGMFVEDSLNVLEENIEVGLGEHFDL